MYYKGYDFQIFLNLHKSPLFPPYSHSPVHHLLRIFFNLRTPPWTGSSSTERNKKSIRLCVVMTLSEAVISEPDTEPQELSLEREQKKEQVIWTPPCF